MKKSITIEWDDNGIFNYRLGENTKSTAEIIGALEFTKLYIYEHKEPGKVEQEDDEIEIMSR